MFYQLIYFLIFSGSFIIDRLSKSWAVAQLAHEPMIITNNLSCSLAWNPGISWSMLQFSTPLYFWLLTSLIALVIVTFSVYTILQYRSGFTIFFETMILAGAISNLVDRCWYGAVVDFIELHVHGWYWPTFNIADACIVGGVFGIIIKTVYDSYDNKH